MPTQRPRQDVGGVVSIPTFLRGGRRGHGDTRIALFNPTICRGGVDTVNCNLARGLDPATYGVDAVAWNTLGDAVQRDIAFYDNVLLLNREPEYWGALPDETMLASLEGLFGDRQYSVVITTLSSAANIAAHRAGIPAIEYWHGYCMWNAMPKPADHIVAVSHDSARTILAQRQVDVPVTVIHNAVDVPLYGHATRDAALRLLNVDAERIVIWVGRFSQEKLPEDAMRVVAQVRQSHPEVALVMVGACYTGEETWYRRFAEDIGLEWERSIFWRELDRADMPTAYAAADVLLSTSLEEGLGMVILEAMASGVPIVMTGAGGCMEAAGGVSLVAETRSIGPLAEHVCRLLDNRPFAVAMAAEAQQRAREQFDLPIQCAVLEQVLKEVLSR